MGWAFLAWVNLSSLTAPFFLDNRSLTGLNTTVAALATLPSRLILLIGIGTLLSGSLLMAAMTIAVSFLGLVTFLYGCTPIWRSLAYASVTFVTVLMSILGIFYCLAGAAYK